MKPCLICQQPKTHHSDYGWRNFNKDGHDFKADNLAYLERKVKLKEARDKAHKLNWCQICLDVRKSPFGICKECSAKIIAAKTSFENREVSEIKHDAVV